MRNYLLNRTADILAFFQAFQKIFTDWNTLYVGWGWISNEADRPDVLQEVELTVKDNEACKKSWPRITKNMICIKIEGGKGTCRVIYFNSKSILFKNY